MAEIYIPATGECEFLDDLDFIAEARTVRFSLDGTHYEVDLSAANLEKIREALQPSIKVSHIVRRETLNDEVSSPGFAVCGPLGDASLQVRPLCQRSVECRLPGACVEGPCPKSLTTR